MSLSAAPMESRRARLLGALGLKVQEIDRRLNSLQDQWLAIQQLALPDVGGLPTAEDPAHTRYSPRLIPSIAKQKEIMAQLRKGLLAIESGYQELHAAAEEEQRLRHELLSLTPEPPPPPDEPAPEPETPPAAPPPEAAP